MFPLSSLLIEFLIVLDLTEVLAFKKERKKERNLTEKSQEREKKRKEMKNIPYIRKIKNRRTKRFENYCDHSTIFFRKRYGVTISINEHNILKSCFTVFKEYV